MAYGQREARAHMTCVVCSKKNCLKAMLNAAWLLRGIGVQGRVKIDGPPLLWRDEGKVLATPALERLALDGVPDRVIGA